jgi:hypothetical protein
MAAAGAIFFELDTIRVVPPVLLGGVIPFFTLRTFHGDDRSVSSASRHNLDKYPLGIPYPDDGMP